jgi:MFS family permease
MAMGSSFGSTPFVLKLIQVKAFYINLIIAAVMAPVMTLFIPRHQPRPKTSFLNKVREMDWLGILLIAAVYTTYVVALTFGGQQWPWSDGRFIAVITICGVLLLTFILTQYFTLFTTKDRRIFPGQFLRRKSLMLQFFSMSSACTTLFIGAYYIPLFFQFAHNDSALQAAVRLLPFIMVTITCIMLNGGLMPVFGYYMPWYVFGGIFTIDSDTTPSRVYGYSVIMGMGAGLAQQSAYSIAAAKVAPHEIPAAIGFINIAQIGAVVIALTISGAVFQNVAFHKLEEALAGKGFSVQEVRGAIAGTQSAVFRSGTPEVREAAVKAIIEAMDKVYALVIAAGALMLVSSLFMKRERLFMKVVAGG